MFYYATRLLHSHSWNNELGLRQQERWDEHAAFMDALVDDGFIVLGGPLADGESVLLIANAASEEEVRTRLGEDPWIKMGLLAITRIEGWQILLDGRK